MDATHTASYNTKSVHVNKPLSYFCTLWH